MPPSLSIYGPYLAPLEFRVEGKLPTEETAGRVGLRDVAGKEGLALVAPLRAADANVVDIRCDVGVATGVALALAVDRRDLVSARGVTLLPG
jgi:hypothetical protein